MQSQQSVVIESVLLILENTNAKNFQVKSNYSCRHTGRIDCLGSVQQKVTVNATDDSFNMTRNRMTLAKEEEQKIRFTLYPILCGNDFTMEPCTFFAMVRILKDNRPVCLLISSSLKFEKTSKIPKFVEC